MTRSRTHRPRRIAGLTLALSLLSWTALAQSRAGNELRVTGKGQSIMDWQLVSKCVATPATEIYIAEHGGSFEIAAAFDQMTVVRFPNSVNFENAIFVHDGLDVEQADNMVMVTPRAKTFTGTRTNVLMTAGEFSTTMSVRITDDPDQYTSLVYVTPLPREEYERVKAARRKHASDPGHRRRTAEILLKQKDISHDDRRGPQLGGHRVLYEDGGFVRLSLVRAKSVEGDRYIEFEADNQTYKKFELAEVQILEGEREGVRAEVVMEESVQASGDLLGVVKPREQAKGMIIVPEEIQSSLGALSVQFSGPNMSHPIVVAAQTVTYRLSEEDKRRIEEERLRMLRTKQLIISLRAFGGGFWVTDGAGQNKTDATSIKGLGVRLTQGISKLWALEAEFAGATTGEGHFQGVSWDGMQGDVTRSAMLGRFRLGVVAHFGDKVSPHARVGGGVQGASYDSKLDTGDTVLPGPGDSFALEGFFFLGGGVDLRLGQHVLAGVDFSYQESSQSLEAGIHVGYGWNP